MADTAFLEGKCSTCGRTGGPDEFYGGSTECRPCKRNRSRQNRLVIAQKVALAERLLDIVERLAGQGSLDLGSSVVEGADV